MLQFPDNPLLKPAVLTMPKPVELEAIVGTAEDLRRKLVAREAENDRLKTLIKRHEERIADLQNQLGNLADERRFATITL